MNQRVFWVIVEAALDAHPINRIEQETFIKRQLESFEQEELLLFQVFCEQLMNGVYTTDIAMAAYVLQQGYSEDWFKEFRGWLIGQGERMYMKVVDNADAICNLLEQYQTIDGYEPQLSLDLLAKSIVREKWGIYHDDFMLSVQKELAAQGTKKSSIEMNINEMSVEELYAVVPCLMDAYWGL